MQLNWLGGAQVIRALLLCLLATEAFAQFSVSNGHLFRGDEQVVVRGIVYSAKPLSELGLFGLDSCGLSRDFPLIKALGANSVVLEQRLTVGSDLVTTAAATNDLYWIAGYPLTETLNVSTDLSNPATRREILDDLLDYADPLLDDPRLIAIAFGNDSAPEYERLTGRNPNHFYSLLAEAAALLQLGQRPILATSIVSDPSEVGSFAWGSDDANQPDLAFWSLDSVGLNPLRTAASELRSRTVKPVLFSAVGIDAFDSRSQSEDPASQAALALEFGREAIQIAQDPQLGILGAAWREFTDQWWRTGSAGNHDTQGTRAPAFPDGSSEPEWFGLFGRRQEFGGANLRARPAYFALAEAWGGSPPLELTDGIQPTILGDGFVNAASGLPIVAPGSLVEVRGGPFSATPLAATQTPALPNNLGAVSVCVANQSIRLYAVGADTIRAVLPKSTPIGSGQAIVYRAGRISNVVVAEVREAAPGILPRAVFRPGLPCPVDLENGVFGGAHLELYGTGLGNLPRQVVSGLVDGQTILETVLPRARLGSDPIVVTYAGELSGAPGVNQINVILPSVSPVGANQLRIVAAGTSSNAYGFAIVDQAQAPGLSIAIREPIHLVIQENGPAQSVSVDIAGRDGFCGLVRFELDGLPVGIEASIPVGLPGQTVSLSLTALSNSPLVDGRVVTLRAISPNVVSVERTFRVTTLPAQGDIDFEVISGGWLSSNPIAQFSMAGRLLYTTNGGGPGRGFNFLTIDARTGVLGAVRRFDTWGSTEAVDAMEDYLHSIPTGTLVLAAIADDGSLLIDSGTRQLISDTLGSGLIDNLEYQWSWAIISRKGAAQPIAEGLRPNGTVVLKRLVSFPLPEL